MQLPTYIKLKFQIPIKLKKSVKLSNFILRCEKCRASSHNLNDLYRHFLSLTTVGKPYGCKTYGQRFPFWNFAISLDLVANKRLTNPMLASLHLFIAQPNRASHYIILGRKIKTPMQYKNKIASMPEACVSNFLELCCCIWYEINKTSLRDEG